MRLQDYQAAVEAAETTEALWSAFSGFFRGTEVKRVSYVHLPPLGAPDDRKIEIKMTGFPAEAVERYVADRLYRDNPILIRAQRRAEPVYWDEVESLSLTQREVAFVEEFHKVGLEYGVGIPVYGPDGRRGQCGLGFVDGVRRLQPNVLKDYMWVCQFGHLRYCALIRPTLGPVPALSERETEVLVWVARGKSNGLIGDILGISSNTVDAHLRRIYLKLGVFDRLSAAVRGIGIGLIHAET
jgi:LuxR family transcriptional regulator/LuxR family quorum-sensing system transcriptional regulator CciR